MIRSSEHLSSRWVWRREAKAEVNGLEIHFGKPVVARVRKCRTVVVKNKRQGEEEKK